ncbi:MAG TPA: hypothetical protein VGE34_02755 [Candidatus Saccharimonadales bacterium]
MAKDVIYIDVEDDITAIITKVKQSKGDAVSLVPPKRVGLLQSAVNLRLLHRAAKQSDKQLSLVTNNHALLSLAASAKIPVAKNLQDAPTLAETPSVDTDDDEVIDGASLPVGDHDTQVKDPDSDKEKRANAMAAALAEAPKDGKATPKPKAKSGPKVPNFDKFRKKMVLIILGVILLIAFLIWAIFFAARATIVINAKTESQSVNTPVTISSSVATDFDKLTLKATSVEQSEEKSVDFTPTGKKDVGEKATGTVNYENSSLQTRSIPAGTTLSSASGAEFVTDEAVSVPGASFPCGNITCASPGTASGAVTAAENGSKYNGASGAVSGEPSNISGSFAGATSGGVSKMVTVVTAADVQKAKQKLADQNNDTVEAELEKKFVDATAIKESLNVSYKGEDVSPAVGEEAESASISATVTYTMYGVEKSELDSFLDSYFKNELGDTTDQRVYKNGSDKVSFQDATKAKDGAKATLVATGYTGPKIDDNTVKDEAKGKRYGEIQESLKATQGVEGVDVKFFPFWVNTVPNETDRITIEFKLDESE